MNTLRNDLVNKIKKMPEEWLLLINQAISNLSDLSKNSIYDSHIHACPYCGSHLIRNGTQCGKQRYRCKCCNKTFTCTVNTVLYYSRTGEKVWKEVLADTLDFVSIDKTAKRLGLSHNHVFCMRHKILAAMESSETEKQTVLSDVKECDETFVLESLKGAKIPAGYWRNPRKHGAKAQKRGISDEYVCICTGIGRENGAVAVSVNRAKPDEAELKAAFKGYLDEYDLVLCDGHKSYRSLATEYGCSIKDVNLETDQYFHLNNANSFHSFIKKHYVHYGGVATKYLNRYNVLFARAYRKGKTFLDDMYKSLFTDSMQNSYFSNQSLKTCNLLNL